MMQGRQTLFGDRRKGHVKLISLEGVDGHVFHFGSWKSSPESQSRPPEKRRRMMIAIEPPKSHSDQFISNGKGVHGWNLAWDCS